MFPFQLGGFELLVVALIVLSLAVPIGLVVFLFYRVADRPPDGVDGSQRATDPAGRSDRQNQHDREESRDRQELRDWQDQRAERGRDGKRPARGFSPSMRRVIDWVVVVGLFLVGVAGTLGGVLVVRLADRDRIEEFVADDIIHSDILSDATLVDATHTVGVWGGFGLLAAGLLFVLAGVAFAGYRVRLDRALATETETAPSMASNALLGAVVTVVASFVPFSPVLGGAVAGYLQYDDPWAGFYAGVLVGLFVAVPLVVVLGAISIGLFAAGLVLLGVTMVLGLLFTVVFELALSAVGGYAGGYLVSRDA